MHTSEAQAHSGIAVSGTETTTRAPNIAQQGRLTRGDVVAEMAKADLVVWDRTFRAPPDADILVNATSIGLYPDIEGRLDLDLSSLKPSMIVADVIR